MTPNLTSPKYKRPTQADIRRRLASPRQVDDAPEMGGRKLATWATAGKHLRGPIDARMLSRRVELGVRHDTPANKTALRST